MMSIEIHPIEPTDIPAIHQAVETLWGSHVIIVHLEQYNCDDLPGFAAYIEGDLVGFLHYEIRDEVCEVMTLASLTNTRGIGTALMSAAERIAAEENCTCLQVTTTNDNLHAIAFYQHRGFRIKEVYPGRIEQARKIKPSIPLIGESSIPIEDEILLEKEL